MNAPAKFLVLADSATRALLFDQNQRLLGEVIEDDGFIVDNLMARAIACPMPSTDMLDAMTPPPSSSFPVQCFALRGS
jgi:hypothetical protein